MEWFTWIMWLGVAVVFGLIEVLTVNFYTIWLSVSAIVTAILSVFIVDPIWQIVIFSVLSLILVILSEKMLRKIIFSGKEHIAMNAEALSGEYGIVVSRIRNDRGEGVVKIKGISWSARSIDNSVIPVGRRVKVIQIEGVKLIVTQATEQNGARSVINRVKENIMTSRIIETQSFKKMIDADINCLKLNLDDPNIDRVNIEVSNSDDIICDYDIGLKDESKGREFELWCWDENGNLHITPVPGEMTEGTQYNLALRLSMPNKIRLIIQAHMGILTVKDNWNADMDIQDLGDLDIETADINGHARIRSTSGDVKTGKINSIDLKSSSGDVSIDDCSHSKIKTASGDVHIGTIGDGTIQVSSGDLDITNVSGELTVVSSSGDVSMGTIQSSKTLSIVAKSGDLHIDMLESTSSHSTIHTTSGDIFIGINNNSSISGACNTVSGDISIIGAHDEGTISSQKKTFTIGDGNGRLEISSISGDIDIKTRKE